VTGLMIAACEKSVTDLCGGDRPEQSLTWLKSKIDVLASAPDCTSISRSTYKSQTVFIVANCEPNVNSIPALFDCDGKQLTLTTEEYQNLNFTGSIELIWKNR
jgi:hypothetical protein